LLDTPGDDPGRPHVFHADHARAGHNNDRSIKHASPKPILMH
jgi:hypothetical protein